MMVKEGSEATLARTGEFEAVEWRRETAMNIQEMAERVKDNIGQVIVGEDKVIELALAALLKEL